MPMGLEMRATVADTKRSRYIFGLMSTRGLHHTFGLIYPQVENTPDTAQEGAAGLTLASSDDSSAI